MSAPPALIVQVPLLGSNDWLPAGAGLPMSAQLHGAWAGLRRGRCRRSAGQCDAGHRGRVHDGRVAGRHGEPGQCARAEVQADRRAGYGRPVIAIRGLVRGEAAAAPRDPQVGRAGAGHARDGGGGAALGCPVLDGHGPGRCDEGSVVRGAGIGAGPQHDPGLGRRAAGGLRRHLGRDAAPRHRLRGEVELVRCSAETGAAATDRPGAGAGVERLASGQRRVRRCRQSSSWPPSRPSTSPGTGRTGKTPTVVTLATTTSSPSPAPGTEKDAWPLASVTALPDRPASGPLVTVKLTTALRQAVPAAVEQCRGLGDRLAGRGGDRGRAEGQRRVA